MKYDLKSNPIKIKQHQLLNDHTEAARNILDLGLPCSLQFDAMDNDMSKAFIASYHGRFAMFEDGWTVIEPLYNYRKEVELWLEKTCKNWKIERVAGAIVMTWYTFPND